MVITARPVGSYRAVAGAVRTQLLATERNAGVTSAPDDLTRDRIDTIRDLLKLGSQFGPQPERRLDTSAGSSPAKLDLARALARMVPKELPAYAEDQFDMEAW